MGGQTRLCGHVGERVGRRVVEVDVWVFRQPAVDLGLVGVQVVQDDVNFLIRVSPR